MQAIDEQELIRMRSRIDELLAKAAEQQPNPFRVVEIHDQVIEFTKGIFGGEPRIEVVQDPEFGNCSFAVRVEASGDVEHLWPLSRLWHQGIRNVTREMAVYYCLMLIPTDDSQ